MVYKKPMEDSRACGEWGQASMDQDRTAGPPWSKGPHQTSGKGGGGNWGEGEQEKPGDLEAR